MEARGRRYLLDVKSLSNVGKETGRGGLAPSGTVPSGGQNHTVSSAPEAPACQEQTPPVSSSTEGESTAEEISREDALAIALENAGVPQGDAHNIKNETDRDNGIPLYDIEFETDYGDYDFEVSMADGLIVGADYEVDEEWLGALGGSPVTEEEAASIVAGRSPTQVRQTWTSGRSPAMAGGVTRERCSWTARNMSLSWTPRRDGSLTGAPICGTDRHIKTAWRRHICLLHAASLDRETTGSAGGGAS